MESAVYRDLMVDSIKLQYDTQCKKVLANKVILAWILKYTVAEFRDFSIDEIKKCIEGDPEIGTTRVNPGETNHPDTEKITGENTESSVPDEGSIYFDIKFYAYHPANKKKVKIIINVEAQKGFYPGYSIVTRGIFYAARMVSAQLDTEFAHPDYDGIKKVYSIWLCMNAPQYIGNAITEYHMTKNDIIGDMPDRKKEYDKISVVMVCLNRETESENQLTAMLNVLFSEKMDKEEKIKRLERDYNIPMETEMKKEMNIMCNLSDYVEECGIKKGIEQGIEQGLEQGIERGGLDKTKQFIQNLLNRGMSDEDIRSLAECEQALIDEVRQTL